MCFIAFTNSTKRLEKLFSLDDKRGCWGWSLTTTLANDYHFTIDARKFDAKDKDIIFDEGRQDLLLIGHLLTPTGSVKKNHPVRLDGNLLWHNGLIKQSSFLALADELGLNPNKIIDSELILAILAKDMSLLEYLEGSMACVYYDADEDTLFAFRNNLSPLYLDKTCKELSSITPADEYGWEPLVPDMLYEYDIEKHCWYFYDELKLHETHLDVK